jgi:hypothetical protein
MIKKTFFCIFVCLIIIAINRSKAFKLNEKYYDYDLADITFNKNNGRYTYEIKAYKNTINDLIIKKKESSNYNQLEWVSTGMPKIVKNPNGNNLSSIINFTPEGFHIYVHMLTKHQAKLISQNIQSKYKIKINPDQIHNIPLASFKCESKLVNSKTDVYSFKGKVNNFERYPLKIEFWAPIYTKERLFIENKLKKVDKKEINLTCKLASRKKLKKKKFKCNKEFLLHISFNIIEDRIETTTPKSAENNLFNETFEEKTDKVFLSFKNFSK